MRVREPPYKAELINQWGTPSEAQIAELKEIISRLNEGGLSRAQYNRALQRETSIKLNETVTVEMLESGFKLGS